MTPRPLLAVLLLLLLPGCGNDDAVLTELRALRRDLAARRQAPDTSAVAAALQPLREVLAEVLAEQEATRRRQARLTEELGRWAEHTASDTPGAPAELQALRERLADLEAQLAAQEERHREVEAMMQEALASTVDKLDGFLRAVGEMEATGGTPSTPPSGDQGRSDGNDDAAEPGPRADPPAPAGRDPGDGREAGGSGAGPPPSWSLRDPWLPWLVLAALLVSASLWWRLLQDHRRRRRTRRWAGDDEFVFVECGETNGGARTTPAPEPTAERTPPPTARGPSPASAAPADPPASTATETETPPIASASPQVVALGACAPPSRTAAIPRDPGACTFRVRARDAVEAERILAAIAGEEPWLLRRPAPRLEMDGDEAEVHLHFLPSTPRAERHRVLARLRASLAA